MFSVVVELIGYKITFKLLPPIPYFSSELACLDSPESLKELNQERWISYIQLKVVNLD